VDELQLRYVDLPELCRESDIVSLHMPLTPATRHLIDATALRAMKPA
jgi:D-lactate dehydrogenase